MTSTLPSQGERVERVLLFAIDDGRFAVDARFVRGVVPVGSVTPVPRAPGSLRGVFAHRGSVVPLIDVRRALGGSSRAWQPPVLTLLLEVATWSAGVAIDEVLGYEKLPVEPTGPSRDGPGGGACTTGWVDRDGERFALLDTGALLEGSRTA